MRRRLPRLAPLSSLACLSLLACSSDDGGKRDSAPFDVPPETGRADVSPADQNPGQPDGHDAFPPPVETSPAPLDSGREANTPDGTTLDVAVLDVAVVDIAAVDAAPPIDGHEAVDGNTAIDGARSAVPRIVDPQVPAADTQALAADNAAFAFAAYQKLVASADNLVFSPASISIALAMTYAGAAGTTATEMAQALHFNLPWS